MKRFLQGNWDQIRRKLKLKYKELKDEDLKYIDGHEDELIGRLQVKLDKTKREVTAELKEIITD
ncbi:CsbD family protein [Roseivirga echinicomitans]